MRHPSTLLALTLAALPALAQPKPAAEPRNVPRAQAKDDAPAAANADSKYSLTIYSSADPATFDPTRIAAAATVNDRESLPGYAVVRERRRIDLAAGVSTLKFADVAAGIDPTTVSFKSLTAPAATRVLEQNFEYDLVSPDKLLEKYVGRQVIINRKQSPLSSDTTRIPDTLEGKLLSFTPDQIVLQTANKQLPVQMIPRNGDIQEIKLFELQTGLMTKPTLVWKLDSAQAGPHDVLVTYQTDSLTWRADYGLTLSKDEKTADLAAWVTLVNESGIGYPEARLKLVAGDVQRLAPDRPRGSGGGGLFGGGAGDQAFRERPFFEYHLYTLDRPTSLPNRSTKQIELFPTRAGVPVTRSYVYRGLAGGFRGYASGPRAEPERDIAPNTKVDVYLNLANTEKAGLGIPLPAGRVRVYKTDDADPTDPAGAQEFVGEDAIDHTPKDESLRVRLGTAFDVVGEHRQTNFEHDADKRTITETFEITLRNHKPEPIRVAVRETMYRWHQWAVTSNDKFDKKNAHTVEFPIELPAGGEKKVTYTVKYTW